MNRAFAFFLIASGSAAQAATFQPLGDLAGGMYDSKAAGVSDNGTIVAGTAYSTTGPEAFRWTSAGGLQSIGDLDGGGYGSFGNGISGDGNVIVGMGNSANGSEAFRWSASTGMLGLGDIGGGVFSSAALATNADGTVIVGAGTAGPGTFGQRALRWSSDGFSSTLTDLGFVIEPVVMQTLLARAVSANGQVIVGQGSYSNIGFQAFVYPNPALVPAQVPEPLGDFCCGNVDSIAYSISGNGLVIGGRGETTQNYQLFRWTRQSGMVGLPGVAGHSPSINDGVYGINHDGSVMVGQFGSTAFYWTTYGGMQSLTAVLAANGVTLPAGWFLTRATDVSADGRIIVGYGSSGLNQTEAFLVDLSVMTDTDSDGILNESDNCTLVPNPTQLDADSDGYGNICDADINNSGLTTLADFILLRGCLNLAADTSATCAASDMDGSGIVTTSDYILLRDRLNTPPGPSGLHP